MAIEISLGWIEPQRRTNEEQDLHLATVAAMPKFVMPSLGGTPPKGTKIILSKFWHAPEVKAAYGQDYTGCRQVTGFCVGAGGQNVLVTTSIIDVLQNKESEKISLPFALYNYGQSRARAGMRGEGEGSFGSTFAASCAEDGSPDMFYEDIKLPKPVDYSRGWCWGKALELDWSNGAFSGAQGEVKKEAKKRLIKTVTPVSTGESVRDAILQGYSCTRASMKFVSPGTARDKFGALVGTYTGRGGHQESWIGYWHHEQLGELIYEMNQWGREEVYGTDPGGGEPGGCWISMDDINDMCDDRDAEVYAFSQYDGYPVQPKVYDWTAQSFLS